MNEARDNQTRPSRAKMVDRIGFLEDAVRASERSMADSTEPKVPVNSWNLERGGFIRAFSGRWLCSDPHAEGVRRRSPRWLPSPARRATCGQSVG